MNVVYTLVDPTRNYTVLIDTPVPLQRQIDVAAAVMRTEPLAEQAGFLSDMTEQTVCLRMAGGEFCGNAAMSAAAVCAAAFGKSDADITVHVSGVETDVRVCIRSMPDGKQTGTVDMPLPLSIECVCLPEYGSLPVVTLAGISHIIVEQTLERTRAQALAPLWCTALHAQAVGMMQFNRAANRLTPLVYVPAADTLYWENACASGTAAVGYWLRHSIGAPLDADIVQPGGSLHIRAHADGLLQLTGSVAIVSRKKIEIA